MIELREAARVLGLSLSQAARSSDVAYLDLIERGLSLKTLERLTRALAPEDVSFKYRIVPKASLVRSANTQGRLSATQSVLVIRLASIWTVAQRIWKSEEASRDFLFRAHPVLSGRRPIDLVLKSEIGAELVRGVLGRLEAGTAV
jgi:putative toxin-antitoxin system antitoxin component (TIGR02293 family)